MKYQVGDNVRVRRDLNRNEAYGCGEYNGSLTALESHCELRGEICTVRYADVDNCYRLQGSDMWFSEDMLEPA